MSTPTGENSSLRDLERTVRAELTLAESSVSEQEVLDTPIENWLELEAGVLPFYSRNSTEWDTDLLFKKPWTLSPTAEFMFGIGPE